MNQLINEKYDQFGTATEKINHTEIVDLLHQLPSWILVPRNGIDHLENTFTFKNFRDALRFTVKVGELAETADHHPTILTEWDSVTVTWRSHRLPGLHHNDFIMPAKTDTPYK